MYACMHACMYVSPRTLAKMAKFCKKTTVGVSRRDILERLPNLLVACLRSVRCVALLAGRRKTIWASTMQATFWRSLCKSTCQIYIYIYIYIYVRAMQKHRFQPPVQTALDSLRAVATCPGKLLANHQIVKLVQRALRNALAWPIAKST